MSLSTLWRVIHFSQQFSQVRTDSRSARPDRAVSLKRLVRLCPLSSLAYIAPFFLIFSLPNPSCLDLLEHWPASSPLRKATSLSSNFLPQSCGLATSVWATCAHFVCCLFPSPLSSPGVFPKVWKLLLNLLHLVFPCLLSPSHPQPPD